MSRSLRSIAESVGGRIVGDAHPAGTRVTGGIVVEMPQALAAAVRAGELGEAIGLTVDDGTEWGDLIAGTAATVVLAPLAHGAHGAPELAVETLRLRVEALLAADRAAEDRLVTLGTKVLTQVARRGGVEAVMAELAHRIDGWAVLLDKSGQTIATSGAGSLHVKDAAAFALHRRVRVRHPGLQLHPVGEGGEPSAFLVVSSRDVSASSGRDLAAQAAALLDLVLRTHDHTVTERLGRELVMSTLFSAPPAEASALLRRWGARDDDFTAFVLSSRTRVADLDGLVTRWLDDLAAPHLVSTDRGTLIGVIASELADELMRRVETVASETRAPLRCGLGTVAGPDALARSLAEARQAHDVALAGTRPVVRYSALPTVRYLLDTLGADQSEHLTVLLDGLRDADGRHGPLVETLRVFLAENGAWGVTAARLGVHRQTLSARVRRIEQLTGLSMDDADDRAAAWLAIRVTERLRSRRSSG